MNDDLLTNQAQRQHAIKRIFTTARSPRPKPKREHQERRWLTKKEGEIFKYSNNPIFPNPKNFRI